MGARPMARLIQDKVKKPLAEMVLVVEWSEKGGTVRIDLKEDEIVLSVIHDEVVELES